MTDQPQRDETLQQNPCPLCAGTVFRWGTVGTGGSGPIFNEDLKDKGFFAQPRRVKLVARECSVCGNVQWFTKE
ncbi:MAG: hypothetical protein R3E39_30025 [Anaerolineae bacterium]